MRPTPRNQRLAVRLNPRHKELIARAADLLGLGQTAFAVSTLVEKANKVVAEHAAIVMNDVDRDKFLAAIDNPPAPNARLRKAAREHRERVGG